MTERAAHLVDEVIPFVPVRQWVLTLSVEAVRKIRVSIGEYEALDTNEPYLYLVDLLQREVSAPLKSGINRFETLLEPFGLSGEVAADLRKTLFELNQVRNIIVHRGSVADRKFVNSCPWLGLQIGQSVRVCPRDFARYFVAVLNYAIVVQNPILPLVPPTAPDAEATVPSRSDHAPTDGSRSPSGEL